MICASLPSAVSITLPDRVNTLELFVSSKFTWSGWRSTAWVRLTWVIFSLAGKYAFGLLTSSAGLLVTRVLMSAWVLGLVLGELPSSTLGAADLSVGSTPSRRK
jgi:hypothetical protein